MKVVAFITSLFFTSQAQGACYWRCDWYGNPYWYCDERIGPSYPPTSPPPHCR